MPALPDVEEAIARILGRRLEFGGVDVGLAEVFTPQALGALGSVYRDHGPDLRALIGIAGEALASCSTTRRARTA